MIDIIMDYYLLGVLCVIYWIYGMINAYSEIIYAICEGEVWWISKKDKRYYLSI